MKHTSPPVTWSYQYPSLPCPSRADHPGGNDFPLRNIWRNFPPSGKLTSDDAPSTPRSTHGQIPPARGRPRRRHRAHPARHQRARDGGPPARRHPRRADHLPGLVRARRLAPGQPGRHPRRARRPSGPHPGPSGRHHRVRRPAHRHHPHLGVRHLDLAGDPGRVRRQRADRLLERGNPRRHLDPGGDAGQLHQRRPDPVVRHGSLGVRRHRHQADQRQPAGRPLVDDLDRHLQHRRRHRRGAAAVVPAAADPLPGTRADRRTGGADARRDEFHSAGPVHRDPERRAHRLGRRAAGAALLAERALRALPRVRRRRRGLVLTHLHRDGGRVLGSQARRRPTPPGWTRPTPTRRSTTPPG